MADTTAFDTTAHRLKAAGFNDAQAEAIAEQAEAIAEAFVAAVNTSPRAARHRRRARGPQ